MLLKAWPAASHCGLRHMLCLLSLLPPKEDNDRRALREELGGLNEGPLFQNVFGGL